VTTGTERKMGAGTAGPEHAAASRADGAHDRRIDAVLRSLALAAFVVFAGSADASISVSPSLLSNGADVSAEAGVELAGARSQGGERPEPPPRGSSAQLEGGSSADRYGGTSADRGGVAGPHDIRNRGVRQRGFRTGPESRGDGSRRDKQDRDEESDQDHEEE